MQLSSGFHRQINLRLPDFLYLVLLTCFLFPVNSYSAEDEGFTDSVVIFNTVCAKCHEGQCSGRLSFDDAFEASSAHIVRYYDEASGKKWLQKELFVILNHMKQKCAYYPMQVPIPPQRVWSSELLDKLSTLIERNYFIPIGTLAPGSYNLELKLAHTTKVTVQLVSESFDMVIEDCYPASDKQVVIPFTIEEAGNYYIRVYPRTPAQITHLAVISLKPH